MYVYSLGGPEDQPGVTSIAAPQPLPTLAPGQTEVDCAVVGDFDGDGNADAAVLTDAGNDGDALVAVHPGDGQGGFGAAQSFATFAYEGSAYHQFEAADLNGDGRLDLVNYQLDSPDGAAATALINTTPSIVQPPPQATTLSTVRVWGTTRGASITVPGSVSGEHDEAQLSGANAASSSGTFTFNLYPPTGPGPQCTGTPVFTSTVPLAPVENGGASSDPVPVTLAAGTDDWAVSYSGDADNQPSSSPAVPRCSPSKGRSSGTSTTRS